MSDDKGYPKLQWSKFVNGDKGVQYVVRADDPEEFLRLKQFVIDDMEGKAKVEQTDSEKEMNEAFDQASDEGKQATDDPTEPELTHCPAHPGERVFWREGKFGRFYSHGYKKDDGRWVNCAAGKGYKE